MENELEYLVELSEAQEVPQPKRTTAKERYLNMFPESERSVAASYWDEGSPLAYAVMD